MAALKTRDRIFSIGEVDNNILITLIEAEPKFKGVSFSCTKEQFIKFNNAVLEELNGST